MTVHVKGWAFAGPEAREQAEAAYADALEKLGLPPVVVQEDGKRFHSLELESGLNVLCSKRTHGYNNFTVTLSAKCSVLTAQQKILIADLGNGCFGGRVNGLQATVYTD